MSEIATNRPTSTARQLTWSLLAAVPALAIVALGAGVMSGNLSGQTTPASISVDDTREFASQGDDLASLTNAKTDATDESAQNQWQNTVRRRPSPRR